MSKYSLKVLFFGVLSSGIVSAAPIMGDGSTNRCYEKNPGSNCGGGGGDIDPPPANSCLVMDTMITMGDGRNMAIQNLAIGMDVLTTPMTNFQYMSTFNPLNLSKITINKVTVSDAPVNEMYKIIDSLGHSLVGTSNHPIFTKTRGFVQLAKLNTNDLLVTTAGFAYVKSVEKVDYQGKVFNFVSNGNNGMQDSAFANGILVGGLETQWKLDK